MECLPDKIVFSPNVSSRRVIFQRTKRFGLARVHLVGGPLTSRPDADKENKCPFHITDGVSSSLTGGMTKDIEALWGVQISVRPEVLQYADRKNYFDNLFCFVEPFKKPACVLRIVYLCKEVEEFAWPSIEYIPPTPIYDGCADLIKDVSEAVAEVHGEGSNDQKNANAENSESHKMDMTSSKKDFKKIWKKAGDAIHYSFSPNKKSPSKEGNTYLREQELEEKRRRMMAEQGFSLDSWEENEESQIVDGNFDESWKNGGIDKRRNSSFNSESGVDSPPRSISPNRMRVKSGVDEDGNYYDGNNSSNMNSAEDYSVDSDNSRSLKNGQRNVSKKQSFTNQRAPNKKRNSNASINSDLPFGIEPNADPNANKI